MKQFKTVFNFELKAMLKRKSMIITTIVMCVIVLIITTIPTFIVWFGNDEIEDDSEAADGFNLVYDNEELEKTLSPLLGSVLASSAIMLVTVVLFAALSIYIYRFGSLNYGNKIKFKEIIKSFRR